VTRLPDADKITAAQFQRLLALQEAQLRELAERVKLQDELLEATVDALARICEQLPGDAPTVAAKLRDLMFDRKKRIDRASPL
jgi:hypothetical protein